LVVWWHRAPELRSLSMSSIFCGKCKPWTIIIIWLIFSYIFLEVCSLLAVMTTWLFMCILKSGWSCLGGSQIVCIFSSCYRSNLLFKVYGLMLITCILKA
jgi:hypothetical protein